MLTVSVPDHGSYLEATVLSLGLHVYIASSKHSGRGGGGDWKNFESYANPLLRLRFA